MASIFPSHPEFNPLDEALELFTQWRSMAEADATTPVRQLGGSFENPDTESIWSRYWFSVFQGAGSEVIFISNREADAGSVWLHPVQGAPRRLYDNLSDAADGVRTALIDGRLELDDSGVFTAASSRRSGVKI